MMKTLTAIIALGVLGTTGCAPNGAPSQPTAIEGAQAQQDSQAVVKDAGLNGNKTVSINVIAPKEAGYHTQAIVHKWVDADIFEYEATLKVHDGTNYVNFATPLTVTIPRKGSDPKTKAVFTKLKQGSKYQVSLVAKGNNGGTAASTVLNSTAPSAVFDFTAIQDVEDTLSANLQIVFDAVAFSGTGSGTVVTPADGTYANPSDAEVGAAE